MGPTPITAPARVSFLYHVAGFQHRQRNFANTVSSSDSSGFDAVGRAGIGNVGISVLADQFFNAIKPLYDPAVAGFDGWLLELRSGTEWVFQASGITSVVPTGGGGYNAANGFCVSMKSLDNQRFPAYLYEAAFGPAIKLTSHAALGGYTAVVDYFAGTGVSIDPKDAWNWRRSRGNLFGQRWLAVVIDSNQKLRRLRRIA